MLSRIRIDATDSYATTFGSDVADLGSCGDRRFPAELIDLSLGDSVGRIGCSGDDRDM